MVFFPFVLLMAGPFVCLIPPGLLGPIRLLFV